MTLYEILGLQPTATEYDIKAAHRKKVMELHPDRPGGNAEAFHKVQEAFEVLSDPTRRARYDQTGETSDPTEQRARAEEAQFMKDIHGVIEQMVHEVDFDPRFDNGLERVLKGLKNNRIQIEEQKANAQARLRKTKTIIRRIERKEGTKGEDFVMSGLRHQQTKIERDLAAFDMVLASSAKIIAYFENYSYMTEDRPHHGPQGTAYVIMNPATGSTTDFTA